MAITFLIRCNWIVVARLSQNALCQSLNAGATTPIAAPTKTNWLNFPVKFCSTVYLCTGSCMRGSMQARTIASELPSAESTSCGAKVRVAPPTARARTKCRRSNLPRVLQHAHDASCNGFMVPHLRDDATQTELADGVVHVHMNHTSG